MWEKLLIAFVTSELSILGLIVMYNLHQIGEEETKAGSLADVLVDKLSPPQMLVRFAIMAVLATQQTFDLSTLMKTALCSNALVPLAVFIYRHTTSPRPAKEVDQLYWAMAVLFTLVVVSAPTMEFIPMMGKLVYPAYAVFVEKLKLTTGQGDLVDAYKSMRRKLELKQNIF